MRLGFIDQVAARPSVMDRFQATREIQFPKPFPSLSRKRQVGLQAEHEPRPPHLADRGNVAPLAQIGQMFRPFLTRTLFRTGAVAEQHAALGGVRYLLQDLEIGADSLHQRVPRANGPSDFNQLVGIRKRTRNGAPVRQPVRRITVGGKADGTLVDGVRHDIRHLASLRIARLLLDGAFAHDIKAHRAMPHHAGNVDRRTQPLNGVQVPAVILPVPGKTRQDGVLGNVLDGFHHARQQFDVCRLARRERNPAVTHQRRRDAVPRNRCQRGIPADLRIQVRMQVDETRRDEVARCVDFFPARALYPTDGGDETIVNGEIARNRFGTCSINDLSAPNYDVMSHTLRWSWFVGQSEGWIKVYSGWF